MKAKNQLVVLSGILVLLATATIAATYNVQTVNARSTGDSNFGQNLAKPQATAPTGSGNDFNGKPGLGPHDISGSFVSCIAKQGGTIPGC